MSTQTVMLPAMPDEANDSRTASDEAVVCKELLGVTGQLYRIPDDSEVQSVFEDSVKACAGTVAWLCPTLAHAEFKSADDYMVFELIRRGVRAPNESSSARNDQAERLPDKNL